MTSRAHFFKKQSILVVDDSDQIRSYLKSTLALIGFDEIVLARDADTALSYCRRIAFDFVLADLHLGHGRDGYQLLEILRLEQLLKPSCCFIIVSAERQRHAVYGVLEFQPDDYLLKPFSYAELERRISRSYHLRQTLKEVHKALHVEDFTAAVDACEVVIQEQSRFSMHATRLKAELLIRIGDYDQAEALYLHASSVRDFSWARLGLAVTYGYQGKQEKAEHLLQELSGYPETRIEALDWLTRLYISQQKATQALTAVEQVAKTSPRNYLRQHVMATLASIADQKDVAVDVHQKLLTAARYSTYDTADNMLNYARALVEQAKDQQGSEQQATLEKIKDFVSSIKKRFNPINYEHDRLVLEARVLVLQGQTHQAIEALTTSEELSLERPITPAGMLDRARAYFDVGNLPMSDHYMAALASMAQSDDLYCSSLQMMMQHEQVKHQATRQQLIDANTAGLNAYGSGDYAMAIDYFSTALETMPANANIALNLLQALSMRKSLSGDLKEKARHAISVVDAGILPLDQQKRYAVIKSNLALR